MNAILYFCSRFVWLRLSSFGQVQIGVLISSYNASLTLLPSHSLFRNELGIMNETNVRDTSNAPKTRGNKECTGQTTRRKIRSAVRTRIVAFSCGHVRSWCRYKLTHRPLDATTRLCKSGIQSVNHSGARGIFSGLGSFLWFKGWLGESSLI